MAKPTAYVTPPDRLDKWKKMWASPKLLDDDAMLKEFDVFLEGLVPRHAHKKFCNTFGLAKAAFGNRFFVEEAFYRHWDTKIGDLVRSEAKQVTATTIYANGDRLEGYALRGEPRRTLRDVIIDDWHTSAAIIRVGSATIFVFVELRMRGCIIRILRGDDDVEILDDGAAIV